MPNTERLVALGIWAIGQDTRKKLGLPSEWRQENWLTKAPGVNDCGTACCIAGKVALEDGATPEWGVNSIGNHTATRVILPSGGTDTVEHYAARALGLNMLQADALFRGGNDLYAVLRHIRTFTGVDLTPLVVEV